MIVTAVMRVQYVTRASSSLKSSQGRVRPGDDPRGNATFVSLQLKKISISKDCPYSLSALVVDRTTKSWLYTRMYYANNMHEPYLF